MCLRYLVTFIRKVYVDSVLPWCLPISNYILLININFEQRRARKTWRHFETDQWNSETSDTLCTNLTHIPRIITIILSKSRARTLKANHYRRRTAEARGFKTLFCYWKGKTTGPTPLLQLNLLYFLRSAITRTNLAQPRRLFRDCASTPTSDLIPWEK